MRNKNINVFKYNNFINRVEKKFLKHAIVFHTHEVSNTIDKKSVLFPIMNCSGLSFSIKLEENFLEKLKEIGISSNLINKEVNLKKQIFYSNPISSFEKFIHDKIFSSYISENIAKSLAEKVNWSFFSEIYKSKNHINIDINILRKKNDIELGKNILNCLKNASKYLKKNLFIDSDRYFYTTPKYYALISLYIFSEKIYNNIKHNIYMYNYIKDMINNYSGFNIIPIHNMFEKNSELKKSLVGFFHHRNAIGTIKTILNVKNDFIKLDIGHKILCPQALGIIKFQE